MRGSLPIVLALCVLAAAGCAGTGPVAERSSRTTIELAELSPAERAVVRLARREFGGQATALELVRYEANPDFCRISADADWSCQTYAVTLDRGRTVECTVRRADETDPWSGFCARD